MKARISLRCASVSPVASVRSRSAPPGVGIVDGRGVFDRLGQDRDEELRRIEAAQLHDLGAVGREDDGGGPAPALVALRDIGPAVLVDINRDEIVLEHAAHLGIGPGLAVHDVAPRGTTRICSDTITNFFSRAALREGRVVPLAPEAVLVVDRCGLGGAAMPSSKTAKRPKMRVMKAICVVRLRWSNHGQTQDREETLAIAVHAVTPDFVAEVGDVDLAGH